MRKKIILLLIFIVSFLGFGLNVKADLSRSEYEKTCWSGANVDHSLTYNITKFVVDSNDNLSINGWAFIHNCDNYGGSVPLPSEGVWWSSRKISDRSRLVVKIVFVNESNNSKYEKAVNFDGSVSDWSQFLKYGNSSDGWYYKNIGFNFNVNLNDVANSIGNGTISMKINASLPDYNPNWVITEDLAVYDNRKNLNKSEKIIDIADENKFEILNPSDRVRVTGNRVIHTSSRGGTWYWALTSKKSGLSYKAKNWYYDGDGMLWYELYYGNSVSAVPSQVFSICGWEYDANIDGKYGYPCYQPTNSTDNSKAIKGIFVMAVGKIRFKFNGSSDHVCNISNGTLNACTGGSIENNCSKMTVYDDEKNISAVVSIKESSTISPGESGGYVDNYNSYFGIDYSKYNIVKGKTFHYALTYTNTASWNFIERNYGNVSESVGDKAIRDKMKSYYTEIGSKFAANVSIKSNDREEFGTAGNWNCTGGTKKEFASGSTTLICKYELKYLNVDGNGKDTYNESESSSSIGRNFYIPSLYNKDKFTWEISGPELTTVEVRTDKVNKNVTSSLLKIEINSNSNKCYINVVGSNVTPDTSGDPSYNPDTVYKDDKLYVYRSVSVNDPFPDGNIPENWNNVNLINRLKGSYQNISNPDYETVPLTTSVVKQIRSLDTIYTKWDDTITSGADNSGNNSFIRIRNENSNYFNIIRGKHCKFGLYNPECDERVR